MATAIDYSQKAKDYTFQQRVKHYMQAAAVAIMNEGSGVTNHAERVVYAQKILNGSADVEEMANAIVTQSDIKTDIGNGDEPTDAHIESAVSALFNALAGIG